MAGHGHEGGTSHASEHTSTANGGGFFKESGTYAFNPFQIVADVGTQLLGLKPIEKGVSEVGTKAAEFTHDIVNGVAGAAFPVEGGSTGEHHAPSAH